MESKHIYLSKCAKAHLLNLFFKVLDLTLRLRKMYVFSTDTQEVRVAKGHRRRNSPLAGRMIPGIGVAIRGSNPFRAVYKEMYHEF